MLKLCSFHQSAVPLDKVSIRLVSYTNIITFSYGGIIFFMLSKLMAMGEDDCDR